MDHLEDIDRFLEKFNLPRRNQEEIEIINNTITSTEVKALIKNLPKNKSPGPDGFKGEFYQLFQFSSVQSSRSVMFDSLEPMNHSTPGLPVHHQLPEFTQIMSVKSVMPSSHLILCCALLLLPPIPPTIRVFSNESTLRMRWPKYWSFSFSIIPSKEIPGLISFRMDWLDLLAVQRTLKSLLQHHSSKASINKSTRIIFLIFSFKLIRY